MSESEQKNKLLKLLAQCHEDTYNLLSHGAANSLYHYQSRKNSASIATLEKFIFNCMINKPENGKKLTKKGGLSLEKIVLEKMPEVFSDKTKKLAREILESIWQWNDLNS